MANSNFTSVEILPSPVVPAKISASDSSKRCVGSLIVNADDWGCDQKTTDRIFECVTVGAVSSTSAMVFMEDSARSAALAREHNVDCGLHLNLTTSFSAPRLSTTLREHQRRLSGFLKSHRFAPAVYHPFLASSFEYVTRSQLDEFERLYGIPAGRIDGHHHMHLSANVIAQKLLPAGTIVRRSFSFESGEKSAINRWYRTRQAKRVARRHRTTEFLFSLRPLQPASRLERIFNLALGADVEVETHPVNEDEYRFLFGEELMHYGSSIGVSRGYCLRSDSSQGA